MLGVWILAALGLLVIIGALAMIGVLIFVCQPVHEMDATVPLFATDPEDPDVVLPGAMVALCDELHIAPAAWPSHLKDENGLPIFIGHSMGQVR